LEGKRFDARDLLLNIAILERGEKKMGDREICQRRGKSKNLGAGIAGKKEGRGGSEHVWTAVTWNAGKAARLNRTIKRIGEEKKEERGWEKKETRGKKRMKGKERSRAGGEGAEATEESLPRR